MTTKRTATVEELREWVEQGKTQKEIGALLGRRQEVISSTLSVLGLKTAGSDKKGRRPTRSITAIGYFAGLRCGLTLNEIATRHGVTPGTVRNALNRAGLPTSARKLLAAEAAVPRDSYLKAA